MNVHATLSSALLAVCAVVGPRVEAAAVITISEPWVRPGVARQGTEAYFEIASSEPLTLVGARSPAAATVLIRGPGSAVRVQAKLVLPPGSGIRLAPGANRLALGGLQRTLKLGERVPIVLLLEASDGSRRELPVDAEVRRNAPIDDERRAHGRGH